jgi:hypothetical protein
MLIQSLEWRVTGIVSRCLALISLNKSESYKHQLKSNAMSMIQNAAWHGPKKS